jgi:uncharacterized protein (DUF58 family)
VSALRAVLRWTRDAWHRLRSWRRISFTAGGLIFTLGTFAVGFAAMNTGNNLLYLLLGAMLGFIAVSGWLSEQAIRGLHITRDIPRAVTVGAEMRLGYLVANRKDRLPSLAVSLEEEGLPETAFLAHVPPGGTTRIHSTNSFVRRGVYPLEELTLSTSFPFGLFRKERDVRIPGEIVVWPRTDRPVPAPEPGAGHIPRSGAGSRGAAGQRGEYRSLRDYRPGDDPRDIHWRSSARLRTPVIREYERDAAETRWICLDARAEPGDAAEVAVETAASLAARAAEENRPFGLVTPDGVVDSGRGPGHLERVLDVLARVDFDPHAARPVPPVDPEACVVVSVHGAPGFGQQISVGPDARFDPVPRTVSRERETVRT